MACSTSSRSLFATHTRRDTPITVGAPAQPSGAFTRNLDAIRSQRDAKLALLFCSYQFAVPWLLDNLVATQIAAVRLSDGLAGPTGRKLATPLWDEPQDLVSLHVVVDLPVITLSVLQPAKASTEQAELRSSLQHGPREEMHDPVGGEEFMLARRSISSCVMPAKHTAFSTAASRH